MLISRPFFATLALVPLTVALAADLPRQAPELVIKTNARTPIKLSTYKGKPVVVVFILTTCPHCQHTVELLGPLQKEYGSRGVQVLASAIEQGSDVAVAQFVQTFKPPFPVGFDDPLIAIDFMQHP